ncbi:12896_t:CDS:2 [Acaulospora colombiana]|uniref:12896_t:CDS:1 n=1 Tax=Acaulospora colombiana TaxID=27376 RepID=A0ACA9KNJ8_9GLOM|nr:12896_t:CDS:2 [Acaulospora colombiana]
MTLPFYLDKGSREIKLEPHPDGDSGERPNNSTLVVQAPLEIWPSKQMCIWKSALRPIITKNKGARKFNSYMHKPLTGSNYTIIVPTNSTTAKIGNLCPALENGNSHRE